MCVNPRCHALAVKRDNFLWDMSVLFGPGGRFLGGSERPNRDAGVLFVNPEAGVPAINDAGSGAIHLRRSSPIEVQRRMEISDGATFTRMKGITRRSFGLERTAVAVARRFWGGVEHFNDDKHFCHLLYLCAEARRALAA
jgi:hypothetical protein